MARRRPTKNIKEVRPTIIGAGITEQWYFTHLQSLFGLKIKIRPRYFGHETMNLLAKRIEQVLSDEGKAVVVFDTDVTTWDDMEKKRFEQLKKKYAKNSNVVICDSMPSIEFWFLLHYVDTSRSFPTSKSVITQMVKYIPNFDKTDSFLRNMKWVESMSSDGKLRKAYERAKASVTREGSTAMYGKPLRRLDLHPTSNSFFVSRRQSRCRYGSGSEGSLEITTTLSYTSTSQSR